MLSATHGSSKGLTWNSGYGRIAWVVELTAHAEHVGATSTNRQRNALDKLTEGRPLAFDAPKGQISVYKWHVQALFHRAMTLQ